MDRGCDSDEALRLLVRSARHHKFSIEVTLLVGGNWIGGVLTAASSWFTILSVELGLGQRPEMMEFGAELGDIGHLIFESEGEPSELKIQAVEEADQRHSDYIHLASVTTWENGEQVEAPGGILMGLLRVPFSSVDGWRVSRVFEAEAEAEAEGYGDEYEYEYE